MVHEITDQPLDFKNIRVYIKYMLGFFTNSVVLTAVKIYDSLPLSMITPSQSI